MTNTSKRIDAFYFYVFPFWLWSIFLTVVPIRLAMMQTDGMLTFGGAFVTALFGLTALMYARARAVTDSEEMAVRADIADETLRTAFIGVIGFGVTAFTFFVLSEHYEPKISRPLKFNEINLDTYPVLASIFCTFVFAIPTVFKINNIVERTILNMGLPLKE